MTPRPTRNTVKTPRPTRGEKTPRPSVVRDPAPTRQKTPRPTKEKMTKPPKPTKGEKTPRPTTWKAPKTPKPTRGAKTPRPTKGEKTPRPSVVRDPRPTRQQTPRPTRGAKTPKPTMNRVKTPRPSVVRDPHPTRQVTPRPTREERTPKPTSTYLRTTSTYLRTPKPTEAETGWGTPMRGCNQYMAKNACSAACVWKEGYPPMAFGEQASYAFVDEQFALNGGFEALAKNADFQMFFGIGLLIAAVLLFAYRQYSMKKEKELDYSEIKPLVTA